MTHGRIDAKCEQILSANWIGVMRDIVLFPGARVITTEGEVATVAFVMAGQVFVYGRYGLPKAVTVCGDAWGGEHDQEIGLVVAHG